MIDRLTRVVLGLAAATGIFLVAGELLARALDVVDRLNGYNRFVYRAGPGVDLPYLLRPGIEATVFGTPVRVNRLGLRGPEAERHPRPGVHRVLVLGDSVVFGQGVTEDAAFPAQLERQLNAANAGVYEVLNAGVPGYDALAEARLLETFGLALAPEIVVVGTSLNDYDVAPQYSPLGILTRKELDRRTPDLADRSELLVLLRWLARDLRGSLGYQLAERLPAGAMTDGPGLARLVEQTHLAFYHHPDPAQWERLRTAYADFGRVAAARHLRLLVAIFPESYQVGRPDPDLTPQRKLLELCAEVHLGCLDLQPPFATAGGELFSNVQHPNARGHAVAAGAIAAALLGRSAPLAADDAVGPPPRRQEPFADPLEPFEHSRGGGRPSERRPAEAVVEDEPAQGEALRHLHLGFTERQPLEGVEDGAHRERGERALGAHETCLERHQRIPSVGLDDEQRAARREDADGLGGGAARVAQVVEEVTDQHAREDAVAEGEGACVGRREARVRYGAGSEADALDGAIDAEGTAAPREAHEVRALAAADLQARDGEPGEARAEQGLLDRREPRIRRRPAEVGHVGGSEMIAEGTHQGGA
ncbi:MAG TPA: GDSL-type esterase/lipase family protein [Candidatus Nitrosopolaris sp.]|nr:GDSL-type esterase/lipase family protein [Candidatus Nitrosopolaris sp.]